jgi:hypothetical protein
MNKLSRVAAADDDDDDNDDSSVEVQSVQQGK